MYTPKEIQQYNTFMATVENKKNALIDALLVLPRDETLESENYNAGTNSAPFSSFVYIANMEKIRRAENKLISEKRKIIPGFSPASDSYPQALSEAIHKQINKSITNNTDKEAFTEWWNQQSDEIKTLLYNKMERFSTYVSPFEQGGKQNVRILSIDVKTYNENCRKFLLRYNPLLAHISSNEQLRILYGYDFYRALMQAVSGTKDKRKCEAYALLKVMQELPQHAKNIFIAFNQYRSMVWHIKERMYNATDSEWKKEIADGTMTALMPKTYKQLQRYAQDPSAIPNTELQICKLVNEITKKPDFPEFHLSEFRWLLQSNGGWNDHITYRQLAKSNVVKDLMRQGGFVEDTPDRQAPDEIFIQAIKKYITRDSYWHTKRQEYYISIGQKPTDMIWPTPKQRFVSDNTPTNDFQPQKED